MLAGLLHFITILLSSTFQVATTSFVIYYFYLLPQMRDTQEEQELLRARLSLVTTRLTYLEDESMRLGQSLGSSLEPNVEIDLDDVRPKTKKKKSKGK